MVSAVYVFVKTKDGKLVAILGERGPDIPGGHLKEGEKPLDALKREVMEEAGFSIYNIKSLYKDTSSNGKYGGKSQLFYTANTSFNCVNSKHEFLFMAIEPKHFIEMYQQEGCKPLMEKLLDKVFK